MELSNTSPTTFDAVVVGGGPAGLSAALVLGRARRRTLLAHAGPMRNAPADAAHYVFTRDGTPPKDLLQIGLAQLEPYGVVVENKIVTDAAAIGHSFVLTLGNGRRVESRRVVLAIGVEDILPDVEGMRELWGGGVFHCPYCHGWEVRNRPLAAYGKGDLGLALVTLLLGWTRDVVLFTDGPAGLSDSQRAQLARHGVPVREERIERLVGDGRHLREVILSGGETIARGGMLIRPPQRLRSDLAHRLGCPLREDGRVEADEFGKTPIAGVFVAGDAGPGMQSVGAAAASGATAAAFLNHGLLEEEFA
ncbi:MAG: NAD(P)/FAD-dependent oxidoreductase [Gemmatimonadaceae bacterium]|jgi:thioredoxin reductase|nr:NAD(P)/FAD-dependent oxidoreductase [Gemmatimonadaceae bacterium]